MTTNTKKDGAMRSTSKDRTEPYITAPNAPKKPKIEFKPVTKEDLEPPSPYHVKPKPKVADPRILTLQEEAIFLQSGFPTVDGLMVLTSNSPKNAGREYCYYLKDGQREWVCWMDEPKPPRQSLKDEKVDALTLRLDVVESTLQQIVETLNHKQ